MDSRTTEVLIIGSGFGAAAPALRLCEAGRQVLMLEKGPDIVPERDFRQTQDPRYLLRYIKGISSESGSFTYAEGLGGGSGFYELVSLRAPRRAFQQCTADGRRAWPGGLDRRVLDPFYSTAESMLNVNQIAVEDIPQSGIIFSMMMKNLGYTCDRAPYAVVGCQGDGYCASGCVFGAKQSLHVNYLPRAQRKGLEVVTDCEAMSIRPLVAARRGRHENSSLADTPLRYEVVCRDTKTGKTTAIRTKLLVLAGGTVGTARLLLDSAEFLPLIGDQVGRNVSTNGSVKAAGIIPDDFPDADMFRGRSHPGMISYEFLVSHGVTISSLKPLPIYLTAAARMVSAAETRKPDYWGVAHQELMTRYRRRVVAVYALGFTAPNAEIRRDARGEIAPHFQLNAATRDYCESTREILESLFTRNGGTVLHPTFIDREGRAHTDLHLSTGHMVGSARMAESNETGVVDMWGEAFDYPGLVVSDGAAIPTSLAVNTSLTILANAERIGDHLRRRYAS